MTVTTIERPEDAAPDRGAVRAAPRRGRRRATWFVAGAVAVVLVGLGGYGTVQADNGSSESRGWAASSERLEAEAEAYLAAQANIVRGRTADSARLQAAADARAG